MYTLMMTNIETNKVINLGKKYKTLEEAQEKAAALNVVGKKEIFQPKLLKKRGRPALEKTKMMRVPVSLVAQIEALVKEHKAKSAEGAEEN